MDFITPLVIGLVGSFHCIGMCGPIALALPISDNKSKQLFGNLLYNFGRVNTYFIIGVIFGYVGKGLSIASTQQIVSIVFGALLILSVFIPYQKLQKVNPSGIIGRLVGRLKRSLGGLLKTHSYSSLLFIGILNGLLPCGLVYSAVAGSIIMANPMDGGLFMALFGLGTIPAMFSAVVLSKVISINLRNRIKRLIPIFVVILGLLFILRGLNLGIPYISPKINVEQIEDVECCHPE